MSDELKNNIRILMAKHDIPSIIELERRSGVSRQVLDRLIKNKSKRLDFDTVVKLCNLFDCEPGDLFYIEKEED
ncbi:helix-turn-helix domain-containing protein [Gracilibacillus thailandensis]|uniref:Helix-turn-helix domain-containing protein n=1 Tax=Gracilibacillus thailandensis TaxID=563735 RepID=A0A6N7QSN4_9BACI|nr:helix-turn-helix transcriptional regulator [Gracilibacillus thailandensis]MRI65127.1 helix-turn-helix domain-containing protein [Gracilibacillus thailandensis]